MPTPVDPTRLPRLKAALKKAKPGEKLPQKEIAQIYGVTNARFTTLAHERFENFPPAERRGDKTHWYELKPALESMIAYLTGQGETKRIAAARAASILDGTPAPKVNGKAPAESQAIPAEPQEVLPTPADLDRIAKSELTTFRLAREKGEFVPVYEVKHVVRGLFSIVQRSFSGLAPEIDPHGELPPLQRARLEKALKDAQLKLHGDVREYLESDAA